MTCSYHHFVLIVPNFNFFVFICNTCTHLHRGFSTDLFNGDADNDILAGDCVYIDFNEDGRLIWVTSISTGVGQDDVLTGGMDNDILIGAYGNDTLFGVEGMDVLVGDAATITIHPPRSSFDNETSNELLWGSPALITSIACEHGGDDMIYGGVGPVNYM